MLAPDRKDELDVGVADFRSSYRAETEHLGYALLIATVAVGAVFAILFRLF